MRGNRRVTFIVPSGDVPRTPKAMENWLARAYRELTCYELRTFLR